jgi:hypothetical protein
LEQAFFSNAFSLAWLRHVDEPEMIYNVWPSVWTSSARFNHFSRSCVARHKPRSAIIQVAFARTVGYTYLYLDVQSLDVVKA